MPAYRGSLSVGSTVILPDVTGESHDTTTGFSQDVEGWIDLQDGQFVAPGNYVLTLNYGRKLGIIVESTGFSSGVPSRATFRRGIPPTA